MKVIRILRLVLILGVPMLLLFFSDCKKEPIGNGKLSFSTDTLTFDTVFTTISSTTQSFNVYNNSKKALIVSDIRLLHLAGTQFQINVDGDTVPSSGHFLNKEIPAHDSIKIFVTVTLNPNDQTNPFIILDAVQFITDGAVQKVYLQAFGQNAYYHYGLEIKPGQTVNWDNKLPHVILSRDTEPGVLIDCNATLNITSGCKVFVAPGAGIYVEGTLNAIASDWQDSIIFRGVRLEQYYIDQPGQWFGIVFLRNQCGTPPKGTFQRCIINESQYGIYAGAGLDTNLADYTGTAGQPSVTITQCIVKNCQYNAVYGFNAIINSTNSLFYNSGSNLMQFGLGGTYSFNECTMYNIGSVYINHQDPNVLLSNFVTNGSNITYTQALNSSFTDCIIYGSLTNEISFNDVTGTAFTNAFNSCLLQTPGDTLAMFSTNNSATPNLLNQNPLLVNPAGNNFTPYDTTAAGLWSPAIDFCTNGLQIDLFDNPRKHIHGPHIYDAGAVEAQQ